LGSWGEGSRERSAGPGLWLIRGEGLGGWGSGEMEANRGAFASRGRPFGKRRAAIKPAARKGEGVNEPILSENVGIHFEDLEGERWGRGRAERIFLLMIAPVRFRLLHNGSRPYLIDRPIIGSQQR